PGLEEASADCSADRPRADDDVPHGRGGSVIHYQHATGYRAAGVKSAAEDGGRGAAKRLELADEPGEEVEHGGILRVRQVDDREIAAEVGERGAPRGDPAQGAGAAEP